MAIVYGLLDGFYEEFFVLGLLTLVIGKRFRSSIEPSCIGGIFRSAETFSIKAGFLRIR